MRLAYTIMVLCLISRSEIFGQCDSSYTYQDSLPSSLTIILGDSCFFDEDLAALDSLVALNTLVYNSGLELGTQTWSNGRLKILVAGNYGNSSGVNDTIFSLPDNIGNWDQMTSLYLEWNRIAMLPQSFSNLTNLRSLYISNNLLDSINTDFGDVSELYFLDLGYNNLETIPASICSLQNLTYLWLFNNEINTMPSCLCSLNLDWDNTDNAFYPYFAIGGNELCEDVLSCVENSSHFHSSLDQFYYSFMVTDSQRCGSMSVSNPDIVPSEFSVSHPFPNPFNAQTRFKVHLPNSGELTINVLNILGQEIDKIISEGQMPSGTYEFNWNAEFYPSGIYFIKVTSQNQKIFRKILLSK